MSAKSPLPAQLPAHLAGNCAQGLYPQEPVAQFEIGDYRNFVYLILDWNSKKAAIIDPQEDLEDPLGALASHGFTLERVLLTHTHFDHVAGVDELVRQFQGFPVNVHPDDQGRLMKHSPETLKRCQPIQDESRLSVGTLEVKALHTPGHSAGETCYVLETKDAEARTYLFSGDTLFIRDCGRTDLESGSNEQMFHSLQKLKRLPASAILLPGHHYAKECASILAHELETSPPLRCRSVEELKALP